MVLIQTNPCVDRSLQFCDTLGCGNICPRLWQNRKMAQGSFKQAGIPVVVDSGTVVSLVGKPSANYLHVRKPKICFSCRSKSSSVDQCRKATPPSTAAAPTMAYLERVIQTWDTWDTDRFQGKLCGQSHTPGSTVRGKRACSWLPACKICKNTTVLIPLLDFRKKLQGNMVCPAKFAFD